MERGFLADHPSHTDYQVLAAASYPLLLAVDLAETRLPQIRGLMAALAGSHDGAAVRVLLLAREHDAWWPALRRHLRTRNVGPAGQAFTLTPEDALDGHSPEDIYVEEKAAFAGRIRLLQQAGHGDDTWPDSIVADAPRLYGAGIEYAARQPVIYHHILNRSGELDGILSRSAVDDFTVDAGTGSVTDVAVSVLRAAGWT